MSLTTSIQGIRQSNGGCEFIERGRTMIFTLSPVKLMFIIGLSGSFSAAVQAGSVNGVSGVTSVSCEDRRSHVDMSWCTDAAATQLYEKCLVMIHKDLQNVSKCDWQGCGQFLWSVRRPKSMVIMLSNMELKPPFPVPRIHLQTGI